MVPPGCAQLQAVQFQLSPSAVQRSAASLSATDSPNHTASALKTVQATNNFVRRLIPVFSGPLVVWVIPYFHVLSQPA